MMSRFGIIAFLALFLQGCGSDTEFIVKQLDGKTIWVKRMRCQSVAFEKRVCLVSEGARVLSVDLMNQLSTESCDYGVDYYFSKSSIIVDNGCRGDFAVEYQYD